MSMMWHMWAMMSTMASFITQPIMSTMGNIVQGPSGARHPASTCSLWTASSLIGDEDANCFQKLTMAFRAIGFHQLSPRAYFGPSDRPDGERNVSVSLFAIQNKSIILTFAEWSHLHFHMLSMRRPYSKRPWPIIVHGISWSRWSTRWRERCVNTSLRCIMQSTSLTVRIYTATVKVASQ